MVKVFSSQSEINKKTWNLAAPHPMQSFEWGIAKAKVGLQVLYIGEFENKSLKNVFLLTFHKIPNTKYTVGYLPMSVWPSKEILTTIKSEAKKRNAIMVKIEPYARREDFDPEEIKQDKSIIRSNEPILFERTMVLDLDKNEAVLFKELKQKTRYNIKIAQKKGVTVDEENTPEGFERFFNLLTQTAQRQGYVGHDYRYHKIMWETMKDSMAVIMVASYQGEALAAYELFCFNGTLYYPYGGSSEKHKNLMASNLLMWSAILKGKNLGLKKFDMWGAISSDSKRQKQSWNGFTRFKEGYNAEFVELAGSHDLIIRPFLYKLYYLAYKARKVQFIIRHKWNR